MLSPEDHPGIFSFLVGLVVLVLVAVGFSLLLEKRFAFSSGAARLEREIGAADEEADGLKDKLDRATARLQDIGVPRVRDAMGLREAKRSLAESRQRIDSLIVSRDALVESIPTIEKEFATYREDYRAKTRKAAEGEEIGTLALRDGRKYLHASITKVSDVGLEIRHENGFARIHAPDLRPEWQERFQWDDEERREKLAEEAATLKRMPSKPTKEPEIVPAKKRALTAVPVPRVSPAADDKEMVSSLRIQYSGWKSKVSQLSRDRNEALAKSSYQTSVPGQLETWKARATRLDAELTKARIKLAAARARLAASSPYDPLLQARPGEIE